MLCLSVLKFSSTWNKTEIRLDAVCVYSTQTNYSQYNHRRCRSLSFSARINSLNRFFRLFNERTTRNKQTKKSTRKKRKQKQMESWWKYIRPNSNKRSEVTAHLYAVWIESFFVCAYTTHLSCGAMRAISCCITNQKANKNTVIRIQYGIVVNTVWAIFKESCSIRSTICGLCTHVHTKTGQFESCIVYNWLWFVANESVAAFNFVDFFLLLKLKCWFPLLGFEVNAHVNLHCTTLQRIEQLFAKKEEKTLLETHNPRRVID